MKKVLSILIAVLVILSAFVSCKNDVAGFTVTFDANGGKGEDKTQAIPISTDAKLAKNTFTRDTFSFVGWAETAEGEVRYKDEQ